MDGRSRYPTRTYPYIRAGTAVLGAGGNVPPAGFPPLPPGRLYRLVVGLDLPPGREMTESEREGLNDPFATLLLRRGTMPVTLEALLTSLDALNGTALGLPQQQAFVVAEGGQILWSPDTAGLNRGFRWVIARGRIGSMELFVSTAPPFDSEGIFLQLLAWDPSAGAYQYYERRDGSWFWAGNSWDALREPTRGQGPFDSHVNGSLVMKELKQPSLHWHSMAQTMGPLSLPSPPFPGLVEGSCPEFLVRCPSGIFLRHVHRAVLSERQGEPLRNHPGVEILVTEVADGDQPIVAIPGLPFAADGLLCDPVGERQSRMLTAAIGLA